ncbi:MFS transporter [Nocardioides dongkuii]|uniref:MFS transporter n=1 Tax=Nocardioides dongkuii TaxID=2760089 RepID=UPI0015FCCE66|nr:MFS transporter [Nocardioides dongkuii]
MTRIQHEKAPTSSVMTSPGRLRLMAFTVASAAFITSLTQALVVPVLPGLPRELGVSASTASWLVTVTVVVGAVANPLLGRLGDQYGRKRMLVLAIGAFVLGSLICAATSDLSLLLVGRAIQGLSTASIPLGIGVMAQILPGTRRAAGIALVSAMLGIGGAVGLPLAGLIAGRWGLAGVFGTSAVTGVLVLVATVCLVPDVRPETREREVDWTGGVLLAVALVATLIPMSQGATWGWGSPATLGLLVAAVLLLPAFCVLELRTAHPIVDVRLAVLRPTLLTNVAALALGGAFFLSFLSANTLFQLPTSAPNGFGRTVVEAGLLMLPGGAAVAAAAPLATRLISRHGARFALLVACLTVAAGFVLEFIPSVEIWQIVLSNVVVSAGIGVAYSAMPALILDTSPADQAAAASGVNALARNFGSALGSAFFGMYAASALIGPAGLTVLNIVGATAAVGALLATVAIPRSEPSFRQLA